MCGSPDVFTLFDIDSVMGAYHTHDLASFLNECKKKHLDTAWFLTK